MADYVSLNDYIRWRAKHGAGRLKILVDKVAKPLHGGVICKSFVKYLDYPLVTSTKISRRVCLPLAADFHVRFDANTSA
jgi:hypothetical protein